MIPAMKRLLIATSLLVSLTANAQQDPVFSLFYENALFFNPAYAGVKKHGVANVSARHQWVRVEKYPITYYASYDQHFDSINSGMGIVISHDQKGLETTDHIGLNYSYKINVGRGTLRLGTQVAAYRKTLDFSQFVSIQPTGLPATKQTEYKPDIDLGLWYEGYRVFAGFSTRHIPEFRFKKLYYDMARHYYFTTGTSISIASSLNVMGAVWLRTDLASTVIDLNLRATYNQSITFGGTYRPGTPSPVAHIGYMRERGLQVSFAYDFARNSLGESYELNLKYLVWINKPVSKPPSKKPIRISPIED